MSIYKELNTKIEISKLGYLKFINSCLHKNEFRLTPLSDISSYALCFAIFGYNLLGCTSEIQQNKNIWDIIIRRNLAIKKDQCLDNGSIIRNKSYLQLLTFSLSALHILGTLKKDPLDSYTLELIPDNVEQELKSYGTFDGVARSGNYSMFLAIILIHANLYLGINTKSLLRNWVKLHINSINQFGFWGLSKSMSHLQFQNGYHQYEIFDFLKVPDVPWARAADNVVSLADIDGHYAPYPGGGGCYDYDAIFLLTCAGTDFVSRHRQLLLRTAHTILDEQNNDGGFCESIRVRPRSVDNISRSLKLINSANGQARFERIRYFLTLLRPKHNRINTHWSSYSRKWNESDLWDSWFRMQTIARIIIALHPSTSNSWGFIDYPGIGFHSCVNDCK